MKKITVYSTSTCPYCVMLKRWLGDQQIDFTEYVVDRDPTAAQRMIEQSGQMGVPFSTIEHSDGTTDKILGFNQRAFELALAK